MSNAERIAQRAAEKLTAAKKTETRTLPAETFVMPSSWSELRLSRCDANTGKKHTMPDGTPAVVWQAVFVLYTPDRKVAVQATNMLKPFQGQSSDPIDEVAIRADALKQVRVAIDKIFDDADKDVETE